MGKINLRNFERETLRELISQKFGEPAYRGDQIFHWITAKNALTFEEMTDLPKAFRKILSEHFTLELPEIQEVQKDLDGTVKFLLKLHDGLSIESVIIPEKDHYTLCISTQVGCPIGCTFCLTGKMGFKRNLETWEIISQVVIARRFLEKEKTELPLRNIVFMGMGEPLLNFDNLITSLKILADKKGFNFSKKRLTVSTVGIISKIKELAQTYPTALALSLHAPDDRIRKLLIPSLKGKYKVEELIREVARFPRIKNSRITIEYVLLKEINDHTYCAKKLASLISPYPKTFKVNLIPFNPHPELPFERPSEKQIEIFQKILLSRGILTTVRKSKGLGIRAACGQLITNFRKNLPYSQTPEISSPQ